MRNPVPVWSRSYYAPATHHFVRPLHFDYTGYVAVAVAPLSPNLHEKLGPPGGGRSVPGAAAAAVLPKSRFLPLGTQVRRRKLTSATTQRPGKGGYPPDQRSIHVLAYWHCNHVTNTVSTPAPGLLRGRHPLVPQLWVAASAVRLLLPEPLRNPSHALTGGGAREAGHSLGPYRPVSGKCGM